MGRNKKWDKQTVYHFGILMNQEDIQRLKEQAARSTCGSLSEFARRILLGRQVTVLYRNESLDKFLDEAVLMRNELAMIRQTLPRTGENEKRMIILLENIQSIISKIYEQCKHT